MGAHYDHPSQIMRLEAENLALKSQVAELAEALKPFAKLADDADAYRHEDDSTCHWRLKALDLRQARAALAKVGP